MKRERDDEEDPHRSGGPPPPLVPGEQPLKQLKVERGQTPHSASLSSSGGGGGGAGGSKVQQQQPPQQPHHTFPPAAHIDGGAGYHHGRPAPDQVIVDANLATPKTGVVNSAFDYLSQVKQKCPPSVTGELFRVLRDYKSGRLNRRQVITAVSELLEGHDDLIEGFNSFLPSNEKIDKQTEASQEDDEEDEEDEDQQDEERPRPAVGGGRGSTSSELANAKNFIERARQRFEHQPETYKTFISLLREFHEKKGHMTIKILYKKIVSLFEGHPDLVAGIQSFLPDTVESESSDENARPAPPKQRKQKPGRKSKSTRDKSPARGSTKREKEKATKKTPQPAAAEQNHVKHREEKTANGVVSDDLNLFFAIKKKVENPIYFVELLKCLNLFNRKIINRVQLMLLVVDILGKHPDLLQRFKGFIRFSISEEKQLMDELHALYEADLEKSEARRRRRTNNVKAELQSLIIEAKSAVAQLSQILKEISELSEEVLAELKFDVARLDAPCLRSLERLYGEKTREVLHTIQDNPTVTVPIVLKRLKQKEIEWNTLTQRYGNSNTETIDCEAHGSSESKQMPNGERAHTETVNISNSTGDKPTTGAEHNKNCEGEDKGKEVAGDECIDEVNMLANGDSEAKTEVRMDDAQQHSNAAADGTDKAENKDGGKDVMEVDTTSPQDNERDKQPQAKANDSTLQVDGVVAGQELHDGEDVEGQQKKNSNARVGDNIDSNENMDITPQPTQTETQVDRESDGFEQAVSS